jgi:hypothetical protein
MKIQTQAWLLIAGILTVPLLIILVQALYPRYIANETVHRFHVYEDISTLVSGYISAEEWDSHMQRSFPTDYYGDVVIFRRDFLVMYSELPDCIYLKKSLYLWMKGWYFGLLKI